MMINQEVIKRYAERVVPPNEAAYMLNVSKTTFWEMESSIEGFPAKVRMTERKVGYRYSDLVNFINSRVSRGETLN